MRKIVAGFAASLDGYIEGPNGEYDWNSVDKEINFAEQMKRYDAFFIGRKTYEKMEGMKGPAAPGIKNYVFSTMLNTVEGNGILIKEKVEERVQQIKNETGKDIAVFGGAGLLSSLLDMKLVDEISIAVIPVLLGNGKPMVDVLRNTVWLTLTDTKRYSNGTVQLTYDVQKNKTTRRQKSSPKPQQAP